MSPPVRGRSSYHHGELRRALLDAAREMVIAGEGSALSLRAVARAAGVSPAAPYHHFEGRPHLLAALAVEGFEALGEALAEACAGHRSPARILERSCETYLRFAVSRGGHYQVMFSGEYAGPGFDDYQRVAGASFGTLCHKVAAVRPERARDRVVQVAGGIWSMAHGMALLRIEGVGIADAIGESGGVVDDLDEAARGLGRMAVQLATAD